MKNIIKLILISSILFSILVSCDKKNDENISYSTPQFLPNQSAFTDEELLSATYSDFKIPLKFYFENLGDTSIYYVNTVSTDSLNSMWIQLSTNSSDEAKYWSSISSDDTTHFEQGKDNEKFFEFIQVRNQNHILKFRAHHASYLTRNNYNILANSNTIGEFTKHNFTEYETKELIDYLWFIKANNNSSSKILSSFAVNELNAIEIHHYELLIVYGDFSLFDEISLINKVYSVNKNTGIITVSEINIRTINGKHN